MTKSPLALAGAALLALGVSAGLALAASVSDRNDAEGKFDIRSVSAAAQPDGTVDHTLTTFERWKSTYLRKAGASRYLCYYLWDKNGAPKPGKHDFEMCAGYEAGKLRGGVTRFLDGRALQTTQVPVSRGSRKKITFHLNPAKLLLEEKYHWMAVTRDGDGARSFDIAPEKGPRKQAL